MADFLKQYHGSLDSSFQNEQETNDSWPEFTEAFKRIFSNHVTEFLEPLQAGVRVSREKKTAPKPANEELDMYDGFCSSAHNEH